VLVLKLIPENCGIMFFDLNLTKSLFVLEMPPKKSVPKPYIDSALQLEKKKFTKLTSPSSFLEFLGREQVKRASKVKKDAIMDENAPPVEKPEKTVFIGLNEVFKGLKRETLGAVILDETVIQPSTASHFFSLLVKAQKDCAFYTVKDLSPKAAKILKINQANAIGIGKNCTFLKKLVGETTAETKPAVAETKSKFKKPFFTVPVGKNKKKKQKKK